MVCLLSIRVYAKHSKLDSLEAALKTVKTDTNKVNILNKLSLLLEKDYNYPLADSVAREALKIATKVDFKNGMALAYLSIGRIDEAQGNYTNALDYYTKALTIKKKIKDNHGIARMLNNIGLVYTENGDYLQALGYFFESLKTYTDIRDEHNIALVHANIGNVYCYESRYPDALKEQFTALKELEQIKDTGGIAQTYECIGNVYSNQSDYTRALEEYRNELKLLQKIHDSSNIANSLSNIGLTYLELGKDSLALDYYGKSLKIRKSLGYKNGIAISLINIGGIYFNEKNYTDAFDYISKALTIFQKIGNKDGVANCLDAIGQICIEQKKYHEAIAYEREYLDLAKSIGSLDQISTANQRLSEISALLGDFKDALEFHKAYMLMHDSIFNKENTKKSVAAEMNFQFEKKQTIEKAEQDKKDIEVSENQRKQKLVIYFISGFLILVFFFALFAYRSYLQKQKVNRELDIKNHKLQSAYHELDEKNKDITDSINYARRIQDAILVPREEIESSLADFFIYYRPKDIVSGDFYYYSHSKNDPSKIIIAAVDCTGHGVPGAFMSMIGNGILTQLIAEKNIIQPSEILNGLHEGIRNALKQNTSKVETNDGMDIAICTFNSQQRELQFAGALRNLYIINDKMSDITEIKGDKQSIGGAQYKSVKTFTNHVINLNKGDSFYIFSDGYADQFGGPRNKKFMSKNFEKLLVSINHLSMKEQERAINENFETWRGNAEQVDDVLVIGIRV